MENKIVRKANHLIEASYKLSTAEQKIILFLVSTLKSDDEDFKSYPLRIKTFQNFIGNSSVHYDRIEDMILSLKEKNLKIAYSNKHGRQVTLNVSWISSSEYEEGTGIVNLCFDPKLKPFLLQLKTRFTNYRLKNIVQLKSQFSIRIYELLKQYEKLGKRLFSVSELREILGIDEDQYRQYTDFRKRVILVAQVELAEKTDLSFEFEELKMGHSVGQIRFIIKPKTQEKAQITEAEIIPDLLAPQMDKPHENDDLMRLIALLPPKYQAMESILKILRGWLKEKNFDYVARNIEYANAGSNAINPGANLGKGSNYRNYLAKTLKDDFGLAYKDDKNVQKLAEDEAKKKTEEEAKERRQKHEQQEHEKEISARVQVYMNSLNDESIANLRQEAINQLDPQHQALIKRKTPGSEMMVKVAMEAIIRSRLEIN